MVHGGRQEWVLNGFHDCTFEAVPGIFDEDPFGSDCILPLVSFGSQIFDFVEFFAIVSDLDAENLPCLVNFEAIDFPLARGSVVICIREV